ncbi:DUF6869 domain-containing protein [Bradyrhizobium sp. HKCCYLRH2060]|uniref:DUF6869 domain-containing protein n=1 Tax=Bradyrhizobium TaxID=374 RepID=UPI00291623CE|nr:hypothetical protein [Bradyrhizobium sp. SZCCHNR3003]
MTGQDGNGLARAWIDYHRRPRRELEARHLFAAWREPDDLVRDQPEAAWPIVHELWALDQTDRMLALIAVRPIEDLLCWQGADFIERIEQLARQDPIVPKMLGAVWGQSRMDHYVCRKTEGRGGPQHLATVRLRTASDDEAFQDVSKRARNASQDHENQKIGLHTERFEDQDPAQHQHAGHDTHAKRLHVFPPTSEQRHNQTSMRRPTFAGPISVTLFSGVLPNASRRGSDLPIRARRHNPAPKDELLERFQPHHSHRLFGAQFTLSLFQKSCYSHDIPPRHEGRIAIVTSVRWVAVGVSGCSVAWPRGRTS